MSASQSFSSMYNRVRNKVTMIRQSDANPEDNLSELDLKIYRMLPTVNYALVDEEDNNSGDRNLSVEEGNHKTNFDNVANGDMNGEIGNRETIDETLGYEETGSDEFVGVTDNDDGYEERDSENAGFGTSEDAHNYFADLDRDNEYHMELASAKKDSHRILVAQNEEELDQYFNDPVIIEDASDDSTDANIYIEDDTYNFSNQTVTSEPKSSKKVLQIPQSAVKVAKTCPRIPDVQKERLVQLVQNNFMKIVGRFAGANGANIKKQMWAKIAKELNQLGPARTAEQWKATFDGIKASAKSKLADDHNNETVGKPMNRLEEKIVAIYGIDSLDGNQRLGEAGFSYKKTVPLTRVKPPIKPTNTSLQYNRLDRSGGSQVCSTITSGAYDSSSRNQIALDPEQSSSHHQISPNANNTETIRHYGNNKFTALGMGKEYVRPASIEEDRALNSILRLIRDRTTDDPSDSDGETPLIVNTTRISASAAGGPNIPAVSNASQIRDRSLQAGNSSVNGLNMIGNTAPPRGNRETTSRGRIPGITESRDYDRARSSSNNVPPARVQNPDVVRENVDHDDERRVRPYRDRSSGNNVPPARVRNPDVVRENVDHDDERRVRPYRDRSNLRNRYTSYDMVQRSMQQQEYFIEQTGRNHAELIYSSDRNHAEMIGMFNSTLQTLANVARDIFNKN